MGAYLVVAHRTLVEDHLLDHVRSLCEAGDCFVPPGGPRHPPADHAWTDGEVTAAPAAGSTRASRPSAPAAPR